MFDAEELTAEHTKETVNESLLGSIKTYSFTRLAEWLIENHAAVDVVRLFNQLEKHPRVLSKKWQGFIEEKRSEPLFLDAEPLGTTHQDLHPFMLLLAQYARMRYSNKGKTKAFGTKDILLWINESIRLLEELDEAGAKEKNLSTIKKAEDKLADALQVWDAEGAKATVLKEAFQKTQALHTLVRLSQNIKLMNYVEVVLDKIDEAKTFYQARKKRLLAIGSKANFYMIEKAAIEEVLALKGLWEKRETYAITGVFPLLFLMKTASKLYDHSARYFMFFAIVFNQLAVMSDRLKVKKSNQQKITTHFYERSFFFSASAKTLLVDDSVKELHELIERLKKILPSEVMDSCEAKAKKMLKAKEGSRLVKQMLSETQVLMMRVGP